MTDVLVVENSPAPLSPIPEGSHVVPATKAHETAESHPLSLPILLSYWKMDAGSRKGSTAATSAQVLAALGDRVGQTNETTKDLGASTRNLSRTIVLFEAHLGQLVPSVDSKAERKALASLTPRRSGSMTSAT
eukprot:CAMPEP_0204302462 /NCGR_PEP_ID=MMETSP0468-20130131/82174_1 /ASSEMBLY_ACC=CAM_ASM_000383 /TAXON_ID=2969 /ORGANISM="Oxyrrhis marina" /LENGTH=132 /DNA_ID=CAMNT_0051281687 /DNA_START=145 /DNA_END=544 /DNA_ORIENTATION=+